MGFAVGTWDIGLRPPTPSSVEPIGGDDGDAEGLPAPVPMFAQVPEEVPAIPPPSKSAPGAVLGTPFTPPLRLPAGELMPVHVALLLGAGASGEVPEVSGLTPMD